MKTLLAAFAVALAPQGKEEFVSTRVIGYSQVQQWYPHLEKALGDHDRWELLWNGGAGVDRWSDPNFAGWGNKPVSPCKERSGDPDRVVLSVSGPYGEDVELWARKIRETVDVLRLKYANARRIVILPVVGGHDHHACPGPRGGQAVRAARQHPKIEEAIARVVREDKTGRLAAGPCVQVKACTGFKDALGHLASGAEEAAGKAVADFFKAGK